MFAVSAIGTEYFQFIPPSDLVRCGNAHSAVQTGLLTAFGAEMPPFMVPNENVKELPLLHISVTGVVLSNKRF